MAPVAADCMRAGYRLLMHPSNARTSERRGPVMATGHLMNVEPPPEAGASDVSLCWVDLLVVASTTLAVVAADISTRRWLSRLIAGHPVVLGPVALGIHRHGPPTFGFSDIASTESTLAVLAASAVGVLILRSRGVVGSSVSTGLFVGGAVAYAIDLADDRTIVEYFEVGPLPTVGVATVAMVAGVAGALLERWARGEPRADDR
jgi:hypothetical protein